MGSDINVNSTFTFSSQLCSPGTGRTGDSLANDRVRTFERDTHHHSNAWAPLLTIMDPARMHIVCNVQIFTKVNSIAAHGGSGPSCRVADPGTSIDVLVQPYR